MGNTKSINFNGTKEDSTPILEVAKDLKHEEEVIKCSRSGRAIISTPVSGYDKKDKKKRTKRTPEEQKAQKISRRREKSENEIALEADIKDQLDDLTDRSLIAHMKHLSPFIGEKTRQRIAAMATVEKCPTNDSLTEFNEIRQQPSILNRVDMRAYQLHGLSWLVSRYDRGLSCILADEMGLGKTLQLISFFAFLKETKGLSGPHLAIVPLSILFNWVQECKKFCPSLRLIRFHCNNSKEAGELKKQIREVTEYDVCITTYEMIKANESLFTTISWRTTVLDEGHRIKNLLTDTSKVCGKLKTRFKVILTGTPVQNNLQELFALLNFLLPKVFDKASQENFETGFTLSNSQIEIDKEKLSLVHYLCRPFVLRRLKTEVEQKLPPKLETLVNCPLSDMQRFWIQRLLLKDATLFEETVANNSSRNSKKCHESPETSETHNENDDPNRWKRLQSLLAQLRKAANHPYLFPNAEIIVDGQMGANESIITASGKMKTLDLLLAKLLKDKHRVVIFSQFTRTLDIISDYLEYRDFSFYRLDGQTHRVMREVYIGQFNTNTGPKDPAIFILSTRAGGEGVNLYTADTVILFDSDWNPQVDIQAMARVHRIGQEKVVHIYRLVSKGTVEERIVQRAQKKLLLDCMINRGSTAKALEQDRLEENRASATNEDEDTIDSSAMLSALKFGFNACFGNNFENNSFQVTQKDIDRITDRSRGIVALTQKTQSREENSKDNCTSNNSEKWNEVNQIEESSPSKSRSRGSSRISSKTSTEAYLDESAQVSALDFDETIELTKIRHFEGNEWATAKTASLSDISAAWIATKKRQRTSRYETQHVTNVGKTNVLKINNYDLTSGEPSVYGRELGGSMPSEQKRTPVVPENQNYCQLCWDGGTLYCCTRCPGSYHLQCLPIDLTRNIESFNWVCPHHSCTLCNKNSFLFRCDTCPNAFCEDCLPGTYSLAPAKTRWSMIGYKQPNNSCIIFCSDACRAFSHGDFYRRYVGKLENRQTTDRKKTCRHGTNKKKLDEVAIVSTVSSSKKRKVEMKKSDQRKSLSSMKTNTKGMKSSTKKTVIAGGSSRAFSNKLKNKGSK